MNPNAKCGNCRYWWRAAGECHRYAPRPLWSEGSRLWPWTAQGDWCGEWMPDRTLEQGGPDVMR